MSEKHAAHDVKTENKSSGTARIIAGTLCVCLAAASIFAVYKFFELNILSNSVCFLIVVLIAFINIEILILSAKRKTAKLAAMLAVIMSLLLGVAGYYLHVSQEALEKISGVSTSTYTLGLYVEESSSVSEPAQLKNADIGILETLGREETEKGIEELDKEIIEKHKYTDYKDLASLTEALKKEEADAIFINTAYYGMMNEINETQDSGLKCIYEVEVVRALDINSQEMKNSIDVTKDPFIVYLSGNDDDGKLKANGRSDVNILMVVDPSDKEILLVNTPRDFYVTLAEVNEKDKLTHAGMYGVDMSLKTLEKLYDVSIPYYVRLNFTGFMNLIDAMGGITVNSEVDFTVAEWHFVEGENHLSGIESLAFARERYSFAEGDRQRGKNQQAVIKGIIDKLSSPKIITNYADIMEACSGAIETNMEQKEITDLLNYQLIDKRSWNVRSISVNGKGKYGECYSFPSESLSIMIPDKETVDAAKAEINAMLKKEN